MSRAKKLYEVLLNGQSVFKGSFSQCKCAYLCAKQVVMLLNSAAIVSMSFIPDFDSGDDFIL